MDHMLNKLRKTFTESVQVADCVRSLFESASSNDLNKALKDVAKVLVDSDYTLIGGLAIGYHTRPRGTDDVDILLLNEESVAVVHDLLQKSGLFKRARAHAEIHKETGVEIELLSPSFIKQPEDLVKSAIDNSIQVEFGDTVVNVATAKHILALKLDRFSFKDKADIQDFIRIGITDVSDLITDKKYLDRFEQMKYDVSQEKPLEDTE